MKFTKETIKALIKEEFEKLKLESRDPEWLRADRKYRETLEGIAEMIPKLLGMRHKHAATTTWKRVKALIDQVDAESTEIDTGIQRDPDVEPHPDMPTESRLPRSEQIQADTLRQIQELIGQYQMNKSFGFSPKVTQKAVDAVLELVKQLSQPGMPNQADGDIQIYSKEEI